MMLGTAIDKAKASTDAADAANDKVLQLEAGRAVLTKELQSREGASLADAKTKKVPGAAQTADVIDLASRTRSEQRRIVEPR